MGKKYDFKVDSNPRVGQYNVDNAMTKTRSKAATIMNKTTTYKRPVENMPDPGQYDQETLKFGKTTKSF